MKKFIKIGLISLALIIVALIAIPLIFKGKIVEKVQSEANKKLNATLAFKDISLSAFKNFPNITVGIEQFSLIGQNEFVGDTLFAADNFAITTDIMSVIRGSEIQIKSIILKKGTINLLVTDSGKVNWDIMKPSETKPTKEKTSEPSAFKIALQKLSISETNIIYDDKQSGMFTQIEQLNHTAKGDLTADFTNLTTNSTIESLTFIYGGLAYLKKVKVDYKADFGLDLKNSVYEFKENELAINDLKTKLAGKIEMPTSDIKIDLKFEAIKNEFKAFLSLVPNAYNESFKDLKSSGTLAFKGYVKGIYNEKSLPGYGIDLNIENGMFQYPSLPRSVSDVQVKCKIDCPSGVPDATVIDAPKIHVNLGQFPIDARLRVTTPVSDANIDAALKGALNLASVKEFFPLDASTQLSGDLKADISAKGRMSAIDRGQYEQFELNGTASIANFIYTAKDLAQPINIAIADMKFNPKVVELIQLKMKTGASDIAATGKIENHLAYIFRDEPIKGQLDLSSNLLNLNPFLATEKEAKSPQTTTAAEDVMGYIRIPANIDFIVNASVGKLIYDNMNIDNLKGQLKIVNQTVIMNNVAMNLLGGSLGLNGQYNTQKASGPQVDLKLDIKNFDIKQTAKTFNTVKQLAPIAENTTGKVSSNFNMRAEADKSFNFDYNTVFASGSFSTSQIVIEGFEMVKKLAETLKIDKLKKWQMEKLSGQFEIVKGKLFVKPFDTQIGNYKAKIGGSNSIDQSIDYTMNIEIPKNEFGGAANAVLNNLVAQANAKGIQGGIPDIIPVDIFITGTFTDPKVRTSLKEKGKDALNDLKNLAEQKAREEAEKLKQKAQDEIDKKKKELENKVNQEKDKLKSEAEKAKAEAERKAKEEAEKVKDKAKKDAEKKIKGLFGK